LGESSTIAVVAARREAILGYIEAHFDRPVSTAAGVVRGQGISLRYLQRLLETSGATFTASVNELRLQRAFTLLTEPRNSAGRISEIALLSLSETQTRTY
jgi:AraC-like DNA-binding protein